MRTSIIYVCSPSNPEGTAHNLNQWESLISLARKYNAVLIVDECYTDIYINDAPIGVLEACQKLNTDLSNIVSFHSLSKRSNVPGIRSGFAVGDKRLIQSFKKLRHYCAGQQPIPIQEVATALWNDDEHSKINRESYIKKFNDAIIFKGQNYIVINKWAGISSQSGTKVDISIDDIASQISFDNKKLHLVHRLDKDTSGLLILALDIRTSRFFLDMFSNQKIKKTYFAIVQNKEEMKSRGAINIPIFDKEKKLDAKTNYKLEKKISNSLSYVRLNPKTGRKHQLRIHCSESNFPILGDKKYFHRDVQSKLREKKLFLHAGEIEFIGPNKKLVKYSADLPDHFQKYLEKIS